MSWTRAFSSSQLALVQPHVGVWIFLGGYLALVAGMRVWAAVAVRRVQDRPQLELRWFNRAFYFARLFIPAWLVVGIYLLRWGEVVEGAMGFFYRWLSLKAHPVLPWLLRW